MGFIRFLLAASVVLCHTSTILGYAPVSGNLAVQCFYIISGFYMAMILTEKYNQPGANYQFYTNRALKIYPVYWLTLILLLIWSFIVYFSHYPSTLDYYTKYAHPSFTTILYLVMANVFIIGLDWTFLFGINQKGNLYLTNDFNKAKPAVYNFAFNSIAWTVGVELAFYIIAPWLNKRNLLTLAAFFTASLFLRFGLVHIYADRNPWNYMFFPTQIMFFIAGIFSYRLYIRWVKGKVRKLAQYILYVLFLCILLFYYQFFADTYIKQITLFLSVTLLIPFAFELSKKSRLDRFLGNLSYPIYITQSLIIRIVVAKRFPKVVDIGFTALVITILFAVLINLILGESIERYRAKRIRDFNLRVQPESQVETK